MVGHVSIILIPVYFSIIHEYVPNFKESVRMILELEILGVLMGIFNKIYKTNYFFVSFASNIAGEGTILEGIGQGYMYFINLQILSIGCVLLWYIILKIIFRKGAYRTI